MDLLADSDDDREVGLTINKKFADRFEKQERTKDLQNSKALLEESDEDESESESEDDDAELLSMDINLQVLNTINSIRKKDPKIYDKETQWFQEDDDADNSNDNEKDVKSSRKAYKDVLREQLLSHGADIDEDDEDISKKGRGTNSKVGDLVYDKEQERLRKDFLKSVEDSTEDEDPDREDDILMLKPKSKEDTLKQERELKRALEDMKSLAQDEEQVTRDAFLSDYISNRKWVDETLKYKSAKEDDAHEGESTDDDYEADEEELDRIDDFESKYNFRFEELQSGNQSHSGGGIQVMGHARNVEGSVRRVDDKRKQQREQREERKAKERRQKEAELRRLKNLKKQELQERLRKIGEVGGLKELGVLDEGALDDDWDPEKHEELMRQQFGDDFYAAEDEDLQLNDDEYDELMAGGDGLGLGDDEYYDDDDEEGEGDYEEGDEEGDGDDDDDDGDEGHDLDKAGDASDEEASGGKESGKAKGSKAQGRQPGSGKVVKERTSTKTGAGSSSSSGGGGVSAMLDELYQLDYEDIIAGIPCRFKYRQVEPEGFGLEVDDILQADDSELNQFVSLRKLAPYADKSRGKRKRKGAAAAEAAAPGDEAAEKIKEDRKIAKKRKKLRAVIKERQQKEAEEAAKAGAELKGTKHLLKLAKAKQGQQQQQGAETAASKGSGAAGQEAAEASQQQQLGEKKHKRKRRKGAKKEGDDGVDGGRSISTGGAAAAGGNGDSGGDVAEEMGDEAAAAAGREGAVDERGRVNNSRGSENTARQMSEAAGDKMKQKKKKNKATKEADPQKRRLSLYK